MRTPAPRSSLRPVALFALALAAFAGGSIAHAPREAQAQRSASGRGFLGVSLQDLDRELRDSYGYQGNGVLVSDVVPDSPADKIGVREGDIILRIEDDAVSSADQLTDRIRAYKPGTLVGVTVVRNGDTKYLGRAEIADLGTARDENGSLWTPAPPPRAPRAPKPPKPPKTPRIHIAPTPGVHAFNFSGRGRLGVETHDLTADLAPYFKTTADGGVLVLRVVEDTPADKAGLKAGDVIQSVGGKAVEDTDELRRALRDREEGDVALGILRSGTKKTVTARLEDAEQWNFENLPGGRAWMGWLGDGDFDFDDHGDHGTHIYRFRTDGDGDDDGRVRIYRDFDDLEEMSPEDRARFKKEMDRLREEMRDLMRDLRDGRGRSHDPDDDDAS